MRFYKKNKRRTSKRSKQKMKNRRMMISITAGMLLLLLLTIVLLLSGVCEVINAYYMPLGILIFIMNLIVIVTLLLYAYVARKINRKHYGI